LGHSVLQDYALDPCLTLFNVEGGQSGAGPLHTGTTYIVM